MYKKIPFLFFDYLTTCTVLYTDFFLQIMFLYIILIWFKPKKHQNSLKNNDFRVLPFSVFLALSHCAPAWKIGAACSCTMYLYHVKLLTAQFNFFSVSRIKSSTKIKVLGGHEDLKNGMHYQIHQGFNWKMQIF